MALYVAFYESAFKGSVYRLGYKRDLGTNFDTTGF